jgi:rare lipoprotein A
VQVGAFSERHNAEQLRSRLNGRLSYPTQIDSRPGVLYKVLVGPIENVSEAASLRVELASIGIDSQHLVHE